MIIKDSTQLRYSVGFHVFFTIKPEIQTSICLVNIFFRENLRYLKDEDELNFKQNIKKLLEHGMGFENIYVSVDQVHHLVYLSEYENDFYRSISDEIEALLEEQNFIELCKIGFLDHVVLTKDNLHDVILIWDKALKEQSPFLLLYLDDKSWYNVLPFETEEAMQKFVADHTQHETI
ncbi:hypothetical protein [Candidatus Chromulinivorax destructor]|uniref:Uncharacterized protein n=1 Tax=Candidatus Chromulinivorax destructor TaxID=2066483 RepID=A0A345ZCL7_9BACT|nr:hypothetical protein [Candidatus Chromulinivorax destructor]AXK61034.1 hypothetical protein C0J27_04865 [Candidatus Chromulinivorax destructor]